MDNIDFSLPSHAPLWVIGLWLLNMNPLHAAIVASDISSIPTSTDVNTANTNPQLRSTTTPTAPPLPVTILNPSQAAANFNCVEAGENPANGHLYTKLVGIPFSIDVTALDANDNLEMDYVVNPVFDSATHQPPIQAPASKSVIVELVDGSESVDCTNRHTLNAVAAQEVVFNANDRGRQTSSFFIVNSAYPNVRCRVTDANSTPVLISCSTDSFAIRPSTLTLTSNASADVTGHNSSSTPVIKAGTAFTLSAISNASGYSGTPSIDNSKVLAHSGAVQTGLITGRFNAANPATGIATGTTFSYSEAGYFQLSTQGVYDSVFTKIDAGTDCTPDFSNNAVGGRYGCKFGNLGATVFWGRFTPDHFNLLPGLSTPACNGTFTYFGQDGFNTAFTLTARNAADTLTQNYTGSFARFDLQLWQSYGFSAPSLPSGALLSASTALPEGNWLNGSAAVHAKHQISRPAALAGETQVVIKANPKDLDNITMPASVIASSTPLRYGRVNLHNAHGSELLDLPMTLQAEYWNGTAWINNTADACTKDILLSLTDPISTDNLNPQALCVWDSGKLDGSGLGCEFAGDLAQQFKQPPAQGNFNLNFKAPGIGYTGALDVTAHVPNYLQFNWQGLGDVNPSGRATFGIYKGNRNRIYFREIY